jgi:hypothetical protein
MVLLALADEDLIVVEANVTDPDAMGARKGALKPRTVPAEVVAGPAGD